MFFVLFIYTLGGDWQLLTLARRKEEGREQNGGAGCQELPPRASCQFCSSILEPLVHLFDYCQLSVTRLFFLFPTRRVLLSLGCCWAGSTPLQVTVKPVQLLAWWGVPLQCAPINLANRSLFLCCLPRLSGCHTITGLTEVVFRWWPLPLMTRCPVTTSECVMTHSQD